MPDVPIDQLLAGLGLTGEAAVEGRRILEAEGVTNPRKQRIVASKEPRAREAIDRHLRRLCHDCAPRAAPDGRRIVEVPRSACTECGGSANARAVREMVAACRRGGISRLLVVGGSPALRRELKSLAGDALELRLVDGTRVTDARRAAGEVEWADLVAILGSSELAHKVSGLYTKAPGAAPKTITVGRRGIAALAEAVAGSDIVRRAAG